MTIAAKAQGKIRDFEEAEIELTNRGQETARSQTIDTGRYSSNYASAETNRNLKETIS